MNADLLVRLAKRARGGILTRIERATWKADLAWMMREIEPPHRQRKRRAMFARIEKDEYRARTCAGRLIVRPPARARRRRRDLPLRLGAGQRHREPLAQRLFEAA